MALGLILIARLIGVFKINLNLQILIAVYNITYYQFLITVLVKKKLLCVYLSMCILHMFSTKRFCINILMETPKIHCGASQFCQNAVNTWMLQFIMYACIDANNIDWMTENKIKLLISTTRFYSCSRSEAISVKKILDSVFFSFSKI